MDALAQLPTSAITAAVLVAAADGVDGEITGATYEKGIVYIQTNLRETLEEE